MKIIPQPHHSGRWIVANADGQSIDGISYPSEDAARKAIFDPDGDDGCDEGLFCEAIDDYEEGFDAGEWNNIVNVGDELHTVLAEALSSATPNKS